MSWCLMRLLSAASKGVSNMEIIIEDKTTIREQIEGSVAAFLKRGGKVEQHPIYGGRDGGLYGDFARVIKQSAEASKAAKSGHAWVPDDGYVNIRQMAGMTGSPASTLRNMAQRGDLPPACKIGHNKTQWWRIERVQPIIDKIKAKRQVPDV